MGVAMPCRMRLASYRNNDRGFSEFVATCGSSEIITERR